MLVAGAVLLAGFAGARPAAASDYAGYDWDFGPAPTTAAGPWQVAVDGQDRTLLLSRGLLQRFGKDGTPDAAFGDAEVGSALFAFDLDLLDDGTISVVRQQYTDASIVRFDATGARVASFGTGGEVSLPGTSNGHPIGQAGDGTFFVTRPSTTTTFSITKFDATGAVDPTYGTAGTTTVTCCSDLPVQPSPEELVPHPDGTLDVLVYHAGGGAVFRLDASGDPIRSAELPLSTTEHPEHLVALADGSQLVVGRDLDLPFATSGTIRRIAPGGAWDAAFGTSGVVSFTPASWNEPVLQPDRTVLVLGGGASSVLLGIDAGGLDASFGTAGKIAVSAPSSLYAISYDSQDIRTIGLEGGQLLTIGSASWSSVNQLESTQRTVTTERTADGAVVSTATSSEAWLGPIAARNDGSATVVFSAKRPGLGTTPPSAYLIRWVPTDPTASLGPVHALQADVDGEDVTLTWQPPTPSMGASFSGYKGRVVQPSTGGEVTSWYGAPTTKQVTLPPGQAYRAEVRAFGSAGDGPLPGTPVLVIPHFASVGAFASQVASDFGLPAPTAGDLATLTSALDAGSIEPEFAVRAAADGTTFATQLDPTVRLYLAYFGRLPDPSGLRYWMAKRAAGTTIARMSSTFAASGEFQRKYGKLTDRTFVELVYENVLGRAGDPGGIGYWTKRITNRTASRGQVMASFSESAEHVRRRDPVVRTVALHWGMLRRVPTSAEVTQWAGPTPVGDEAALARALLTSPEYLARLD